MCISTADKCTCMAAVLSIPRGCSSALNDEAQCSDDDTAKMPGCANSHCGRLVTPRGRRKILVMLRLAAVY